MIEVRPLPMKEAIEYWSQKTRLSPREYSKLSAEAKTLAFGVAGIAKGAELESVYNALGRAISQGTTFADFKKECQSVFERRGWTGERAWRIDNIFRTNVQTAYQVGRYRQMQRVTKARPYWQYSAINDSRTRPAHRAVHGMVFRHDHPFWEKWYPPNGYRCRCTVKTLSQRQLEAKGLQAEDRDPTGSYVTPTDPKTGNKMPPVAIMPDHAFAHNPGKSFWGGIVEASDKRGKWRAMEGLPGPDRYRRPALKNVRAADIPDIDESELLPRGQSDDFYCNEFLKRYGEEKLLADPLGEPVILSLRAYQDRDPGSSHVWKFYKAGHGESIPVAEDMVLHPYEIWLTPQQNEDGGYRLTKRYICLWKTKDRQRIGGVAVFEAIDGVLQGTTSFLPKEKIKKTGEWEWALKYTERQRQGLLLYRRGQ